MRALPWLLASLLLGSTVGFAWQSANRGRELRISEANTRAALDTTRLHLVDSVAAKTRLVQQHEISDEILGEALRIALAERDAEAVAHARLRVSFDSLRVVAQAPDTDTVIIDERGDSVRTATFTHTGPPIEGTQIVTVPPTRPITLTSRLAVSPFAASYSVGCAGPDAVVSWSVPEWVRADFDDGRVDPMVCNPLQPGLFRIDAGTGMAFVLGAVTSLLLLLGLP